MYMLIWVLVFVIVLFAIMNAKRFSKQQKRILLLVFGLIWIALVAIVSLIAPATMN